MSHQSDHPTARVFFALWPTAAERDHLSAWQKPLQHLCGGRAMRGEMLHNTLVFIGDVEQSRLEALQLAAQEVSGKAFELCFDMAHYWGHNHIVYAAPSHLPQHLAQLAGALEQRLTIHRFKFDQRAYKAHVTLLRNARWTDAPLPAMQPVRWQIKDFALMQSAHQDGQTSYLVMARFPLGVGKNRQHSGKNERHMQPDFKPLTHYERIGGAEKVRALVQRFYQLMDELPEAYGIRKLHAEDLHGATDKLYKFLSGWMGGPQLYVEQYGHPMLRHRHLPFTIATAERDQWLLCMNQALSEVVEDVALRKELAAAFAKVAEHMRNREE